MVVATGAANRPAAESAGEADPSGLREGLEALASRLRHSVVRVVSGAGSGSGTVWPVAEDRDGATGVVWVVTNAHVARSARGRRVDVETAGRERAAARVLRREVERDLALLEVEDDSLVPVATRDASSLRVGEFVFALGHPWGGGASMTAGIVSSTAGLHAEGGRISAVHADVRLAPGNSGGPLVDVTGAAVGINTMVAGGMGLAIPTEAVASFLETGAARPAVIGVAGVPVPLPAGGEGGGTWKEAGLLVTDVLPGSAADEAGMIPGDIVVRVDEVGGDVRAITRHLRGLAAGGSVEIEVLRGGRRVVLTARPAVAA